MSRYQTVTFSRAVAAGDTATFALTIPYNRVNVSKIRVVPSDASGNWSMSIHKDAGYAVASLVYGTVTFAGNLVDPVYADGVSLAEKNQGFVCAYEDDTQSLQMYIKIVNAGAMAQTFTGQIEVDTTYGLGVTVTDVPSGLLAKAFASDLQVTSGVISTKNNATINLAEFRAIYVTSNDQPYYDLRTVAEGGTFVNNGTTQIIATVDSANSDGAQYIFDSASPGRWYYAWRLQNSVGWSHWTDGNDTPLRVTQFVDTRSSTTADSGPPADWDVWLEEGPASGTLVVHATRPATNGDVINWMGVQILDTAGGTWVTLLAGSDPGHLKLDGRSNSYSLNPSTRNQITDDDAAGWGTAAVGDLVLLDVRGGGATWNEQYCQWATIRSINGLVITVNGFFRPQTYTNMRLIIIKPPWAWTTNGFGVGMWPQKKQDENLFVGDTGTKEFITTVINVPTSMTSPEARVWFENPYSRADNNLTHSVGKAGFQTVRTFADFLDTRYWLPLYQYGRWGSLTLDINTRKATVAAVTPRDGAYTHVGAVHGMKGRFRIYPDLGGLLKFRARFENVYIPVYAGADSGDTSCIIVAWDTPHGWSSNYFFGAYAGNYQKVADLEFGCNSIYGTDSLSRGSHYTLPSVANWLNVTRPAAGYTVDMRVGFSSATSGTNTEYAITTCEISINGGAYTALTGVNIGQFGPMCDMALHGITPYLLFFEPYHAAATPSKLLSDWYATISEFEVINGIIVPGRIMSGKV